MGSCSLLIGDLHLQGRYHFPFGLWVLDLFLSLVAYLTFCHSLFRWPVTCKEMCWNMSKIFAFPSWEQDVEFEGRLAVAREPREVGWTTWDGEPNQEGGDG